MPDTPARKSMDETGLPGGSYRVMRNLFVRCQEDQPMHDGLTDQNSVEWIAVKGGKACEVKRGFFVKQQGRRSELLPLGRDELVGTFPQFDLSEGVLD